MPIEIDQETLNYVRKKFEEIQNEVKIYHFTDPKSECQYCEDTEEILKILSNLNNKIKIIKKEKNAEETKRFNINEFPCILIHGKDEYNIRYFGIPAGYEFGALIEDIVDASKGTTNVDPKLKELIVEKINKPTRILVFVTPTCPYCPIAVRAAHRYAIINKNIYGDMIEALEFPKLADKYNVYAVPKNVIQVDGKDILEFEGAAPDIIFIAKILEAHKIKIPDNILKEINDSHIDKEHLSKV